MYSVVLEARVRVVSFVSNMSQKVICGSLPNL